MKEETKKTLKSLQLIDKNVLVRDLYCRLIIENEKRNKNLHRAILPISRQNDNVLFL